MDRAYHSIRKRLVTLGPASFLTLALLLPSLVVAQDYTGFRGKVTDPSGAAVVGATIKATESQYGRTFSTVSNDVGDYELRGVLPGTYTLEVTAASFEKYVNTGVIVYARDVRRVDVKLNVGEVTSTI